MTTTKLYHVMTPKSTYTVDCRGFDFDGNGFVYRVTDKQTNDSSDILHAYSVDPQEVVRIYELCEELIAECGDDEDMI